MLNDKHIDQWAGYLIDELTYPQAVVESMDNRLWGIMIQMYKKGYQDCAEDLKVIE